MSVTEEQARAAFLAAHAARTSAAQLIADLIAEGLEVTPERLERYRVAVAAVQGLSAAYDRHLNRGA